MLPVVSSTLSCIISNTDISSIPTFPSPKPYMLRFSQENCAVTDFLFLCFYATVTAVQKLDEHWCDVTWISKLERRSSQKDLLLAGNLFHLRLWLATGMSNKPCVSRNYFYLCCSAIFLLWNISASIQTHLACTGCSYFTSSDWLLIFPHLASNQV